MIPPNNRGPLMSFYRRPLSRWGLGQPPQGVGPLPDGVKDVYSYANGAIQAISPPNACPTTSVQQVTDFQNAYNSAGLPGSPIPTDGIYTDDIATAIQNTIDDATDNTGTVFASAPPGCAVAPGANTDPQSAALAMNTALASNGFRRADQGIYRAFQRAVGMKIVDGFPGTNTMAQFTSVMQGTGQQMANVPGSAGNPAFPWKATCSSGSGRQCYDGTNAPTWAQWTSTGQTPGNAGGGGGPPQQIPTPPSPTGAAPTGPNPNPPNPTGPPGKSGPTGATGGAKKAMDWTPILIVGGAVLVGGGLLAWNMMKKKGRR